MAISNEMRRLQKKWQTGSGWPLRLDWIEIKGIRGWEGQRFSLQFPIMAVTGENGSGKSTVLQAAAAVYAGTNDDDVDRFASDFFPDTAWEKVRNAVIRYSVREGSNEYPDNIRKPGERWRGNPDRRRRAVEYIDLSRIQPVGARLGYKTLANPAWREDSATLFEKSRLARFSEIMGRKYDLAKMSVTNSDSKREVPVLSVNGVEYSGFHQGAGETTIAEFLQADLPQYGLVLIDEIETSLHPRMQRRLIRDLADRCRDREIQVILTTHSPYILQELPFEARAHIMQAPSGTREIVYGVSPEFAMTKMDDVPQYECDVYVEDERAKAMTIEILSANKGELVSRCQIIPYGASSVGKALGEMVAGMRFPRPSCVFLDGDEGEAMGCNRLPGDDAPERVVFEALKAREWKGVNSRIGRPYSKVVDACTRAMAVTDHHEWVAQAGTALVVGGDTLWQAMCAEWASECLAPDVALAEVTQPIEDALNRIGVAGKRAPTASAPEPEPVAAAPLPAPPPAPTPTPSASEPPASAQRSLFERPPDAPRS